MNNIAISPYIAMYALQIQNVKRNTSKTANIDVLNKKTDDIDKKQNNNTTEINDLPGNTEIQNIENKPI